MKTSDAFREAGAYFLAAHYDCPSPNPTLKFAEGMRAALALTEVSLDPARFFAPVEWFNGLGVWVPEIPEAKEYWQAYDINHLLPAALDDEGKALFAFTGFGQYQHLFSSWQGHATLDYATIVQSGLPAYRERIQRGLSKAHSAEEADFFQALTIVMSGIDTVLLRFADAAQQQAAISDANLYLPRMAAGMRQLLAGPPRDFYEALLFVHLMNALDGYDDVGRLDQYLYPFYARDIADGSLSAEEAEMLLADVFDLWGSHGHWQIVVGGADAQGHDVTNALTHVILKARAHVKRTHPSVSVRLSDEAPAELMDSALELLSAGVGQPAFYHDALYQHALRQLGVAPEDAAEFVFGGCSETHIAGKSSARDAFFNLAKALEAVFYNGCVAADGPRFGVDTGPLGDLTTFDAFLDAYRRQVEYLITTFVRYRNTMQQILAGVQPGLIRSIFIDGSIEAGVCHCAGGSKYDYGMIDVYGIPNVANALYAIRQLVYEEQRVSLENLVGALSRNFAGEEELRQWCLQAAKYGNDDDAVDAIAAIVGGHVFDYVLQQRMWQGDGYYAFCASAPGQHIHFGKTTGATPDGRLAGTPLANSMGAMQGTDLHGPTALLSSVAKLPLWKCVGSPVVNINVSPQLFNRDHRRTVPSLIKTFFDLGGMQLQVNVIDKQTLIDAIEHPENHRALIVRVSGYAARFTELAPDFQQEILSRTIH